MDIVGVVKPDEQLPDGNSLTILVLKLVIDDASDARRKASSVSLSEFVRVE